MESTTVDTKDTRNGVFETIFEKYDTEKTGAISTSDLNAFLLELGYSVSIQVIENALDTLDPEATGSINKMFFLSWFERNADSLEDVESNPGSTENDLNSPISPRSEKALKALNSAMLEAKNERKRAEDDVQLLANRLAHLRAEETKARKRIEEANKRAFEIQKIKEEKAKRFQERQKLQREESQMLSQASNHYVEEVRETRQKKEKLHSEIMMSKKKTAQNCKAEKQAILEKIKKTREEEHLRLQKKKDEVKKQQEEAMKRREMARKKQEKQLIKKARERLASETAKKHLSEQIIKQMEEEEARLIEKLRETQNMQRNAYKHLESALESKPTSLVE